MGGGEAAFATAPCPACTTQQPFWLVCSPRCVAAPSSFYVVVLFIVVLSYDWGVSLSCLKSLYALLRGPPALKPTAVPLWQLPRVSTHHARLVQPPIMQPLRRWARIPLQGGTQHHRCVCLPQLHLRPGPLAGATRWSSSAAVAPPGARPPTSMAAMPATVTDVPVRPEVSAELAVQRDTFGAVFADAAASGGRPPIQDWVQTYYRRPRLDLLFGAFAEGLRTRGAFTGRAAFPTAVFLSEVLRGVVTESHHVVALMEHFIGAIIELNKEVLGSAPSDDMSPAAALFGSEHLDTVLRGLYLADTPWADEYLASLVDGWKGQLEAQGRGGEGGGDDDLAAAVYALSQSLYPPSPPRPASPRPHILTWPLPSLNIDTFQKALASSPFCPYACTSRHLFMHTHAAYTAAQAAPGGAKAAGSGARGKAAPPRTGAKAASSFAMLVPELATLLTVSLVDAYWSVFYATGNPAAVLRVLDAATPYMDFIEEYGDAGVRGYNPAKAAVVLGGDGSDLPEEFEDDPFGAMKWETSRYALWSLLSNTATHTVVGEIYFKHFSEVNDSIAILDPISRAEEVTAFGEARYGLLKLLLPGMQAAGRVAAAGGIGSGRWPASYDLALPGSEGPAALPSPHRITFVPEVPSAPATAALPPGGGEAPAARAAAAAGEAASAAVPATPAAAPALGILFEGVKDRLKGGRSRR